VPRLSFHPRDCVASRPFGLGVRRPCVQAADSARLDAADELVRTLRSADRNLAVFDIGAMLCHHGECAAMVDGELLYRDPGHLSLAGSRRVAAQLRSALH